MRIVVFEIHDSDSDIFDRIMEIVESHPDIECLRVKDEPMLSLPDWRFILGGERFTGRSVYYPVREGSRVFLRGQFRIKSIRRFGFPSRLILCFFGIKADFLQCFLIPCTPIEDKVKTYGAKLKV